MLGGRAQAIQLPVTQHAGTEQQQAIGKDLPVHVQGGRIEHHEQGQHSGEDEQRRIELAVVSALT